MTFHEGIQIYAMVVVIVGLLAVFGITYHYRQR